MLEPGRIALVGASADERRLTARAQRYLRRHGFRGALYPINPRAATVQGEPAWPSLAALPEPVEFAYILVGTEQVEGAVEACAEAGVAVACILADGFSEAGPEGAARQARVAAAARAGGVRLLGPNSMGVINPPAGIACTVNATLDMEHLPAGRWSLVSQSGSMLGTLLSRAAARGFGFAKLISTGNEADLTAGEVAGLLADDPATDVILLFLETIRAPGQLEAAARRAHAAGKPVVAYKLGRSAAGAALAVGHTGAIAGSDAAADAFLRDLGIVRVELLETLFELPMLLQGRRPPPAPRRAVRVVTTTGGGGAMVVDRLGVLGIATADMHDTTLAGMDKVADALDAARATEDADLAIAVIGSSAQFQPEAALAGVIASRGEKPLGAFLLPEATSSLRLLAEAGIAGFRTPESCADAVRGYLEWRVPGRRPESGGLRTAEALLDDAGDEPGARAVFAALGLPDGAVRLDPEAPPALGYPVVLKAVSPSIAHKTEAGAVALGLADPAAVLAAAREMRARLGAAITGFIAQSMARGVAEAILGYRRDALVGPVVALGAGGVLAEIYRDVVLRPAPVDEDTAGAMIAEVRGLAPARGYRHLPRGDLAALARAVSAFSRLAGLPRVAEAEINPVIVLGEGAGIVVADALLRLHQEP
ncbi:MAG: acetate--CoA ligase family protein [Acidisphaera sp.]|nr:acetate--CoA ligase family protein [Acidisphaera sp.]